MSTIQGIPNIGNSCYVAALIQCLRSCLKYHSHELSLLESYISGDISSIWSSIDGNMQDSHEFYMKFMDIIHPSISRHFMIRYKEGGTMPCLLIDNNLQNSYGPIQYAPDTICVYCIPTPRRIDTILSLEIDTTTTNRYRMTSCICYTHGRNGQEGLSVHGYTPVTEGVDHYYAIVQDRGMWIKCDDSTITHMANMRELHPIYMIFYTQI